MKKFASVALFATAAVLAATPVLAASRSASVSARKIGIDGANRYEVRAQLSGSGLASGKAGYKERVRGSLLEQRFTVEVEDATPGDALTVTINGTTFGTIVVNGLGIAEMELRSVSDDPGVGPIPAGFPRIQVGDTISVGALNGTFAAH